MNHPHLILHADGGARGNPGPAGAGAVLYDPQGRTLARRARYLGRTTNNVAEYQGLILGLETARDLGARSLTVRLDSELIVRQLNGQYRVRTPHLRPLYQKARQLMTDFEAVEVQHVPREQNAEADRLVNQAIDQQGDLSQG